MTHKAKAGLFCAAAVGLLLLLPVHTAAATEADVYAALRSIGVPEEYIGQAAGVLARGTSDGAGVYRSNGTYYSYAEIVSMIYANREDILIYCGVLDFEESKAETTPPAEQPAGSRTTPNPFLEMLSEETVTAAAAVTTVTTTTTVPVTTETTTAVMTTVTALAAAETTEESGGRFWMLPVGIGALVIAAGGIYLLARAIPQTENG